MRKIEAKDAKETTSDGKKHVEGEKVKEKKIVGFNSVISTRRKKGRK